MLVLSSALLLLGAFAVYAMVLVPAWGSSKYPAGLLPPRVMSRLNWIVGVALVVAFAGNILALLQQTMVFFGADIGRVIGEQLFNVVRIGTRFGDTWNARMVLLVLVALLFAASLYLREQPAGDGARLLGGERLGDGADAGDVQRRQPRRRVAAAALRSPSSAIGCTVSAVGFWAGGVAALALVAPVALQPYSGDERRQALLAALRRFTRIAAAGLAVVIATGIYSALNWVTDARRSHDELRRRADPQADSGRAAGGGRRGASRRRQPGTLSALVGRDRAGRTVHPDAAAGGAAGAAGAGGGRLPERHADPAAGACRADRSAAERRADGGRLHDHDDDHARRTRGSIPTMWKSSRTASRSMG